MRVGLDAAWVIEALSDRDWVTDGHRPKRKKKSAESLREVPE